MDDYAIVTLDGGSLSGDWYVSKALVQYLTSDLGNSGSTTIYLYRSLDSSNSYGREYISISSLGSPVYHPASGSNSYLSGYTVEYSSMAAQIYRSAPLFSPILILLLGILVIVRMVKK